MSAQESPPQRAKRRGIGDFVKGGAPIVGLTAYTAPIARLLDPAVDFLLVGDSVGMVVYGFDSTLPVTVKMMIAHGAAWCAVLRRPWLLSICRAAATRNRGNRRSAMQRVFSPKPAVQRSSSKAGARWQT